MSAVPDLLCTGARPAFVRHGFSDLDTYGAGWPRAASGSLDAPVFMPAGAVRRVAPQDTPIDFPWQCVIQRGK